MNPEEIAARYKGGANFLNGVPARDLTQTEWDALDAETRQACLALGLYEPVTTASHATETVEPTANELPRPAEPTETVTENKE